MMAIGVGSRFTASVQGSVEKFVRCQRCGRFFTYRLTRRARASAVAPSASRREDAMLLAQSRANKALHEKLEHCVDLYPCPGCGWYQTDMALRARSRWLLGSAMVGGTIALLAGIAPGAINFVRHGGTFYPWMPGLLGGLGIAFLGAIVAALADPNTALGALFSIGQNTRYRPDDYSPPVPAEAAALPLESEAQADVSTEALRSVAPEPVSPITEEMIPPVFRPAIVVGPETLLVECARCGARHGLHTRFSGLRIRCRQCGALMDTAIAPAGESA